MNAMEGFGTRRDEILLSSLLLDIRHIAQAVQSWKLRREKKVGLPAGIVPVIR